MTTLLPLSQLFPCQLQTTLDVERTLSTLGAFQSVSEVAPALETIHAAIEPHRDAISTITARDGTTRRKELRFFDGLTSGDDSQIRLALAELGTRPMALTLLQQDPRAAKLMVEAGAGIRIETSSVREHHLRWSGPSGVGAPDLSALGQLNYWLSSLTAPRNWALWGTGASLAVEGALWASNGQPPVGALATSATLLGGALYGHLHREAAKTRLVNFAEQQPMSFEAVSAFFQSYGRVLPTDAPFRLSSGSSDVLEAIRKSAAGSGTPHQSRLVTLRLITDFLNLGSAAVKGLKKSIAQDPTGKLYDQMAQAIGLGVLSRLRWQPIIFNAHILDQIAELKRQGKNVLFVGNHRSHLDILLAVALLVTMGIRFAAKKELQGMPTLGDILSLANHFIVDDNDPDSLAKMVDWGTLMFQLGLSPYFFIEGTRSDTRARSEELGMSSPKIGAAHLAARHAKNTVVVPMVSYGFGRMLPKSEKQALEEGVMLHQPTVTSLLEPIHAADFLDEDPALSMQEEARFNAIVWNRMSAELRAIQAYMNYLAVQAA